MQVEPGEPVAAQVLRGLAHRFFVQIRLRYAIAGPRGGARSVVVRDLYP